MGLSRSSQWEPRIKSQMLLLKPFLRISSSNLKSCSKANCVDKQITFYCTWCLAMKLQLSTSELKKRDLDTHPNLQSAAIGTQTLKRPKNSWRAHEALLTDTEMRDGVIFLSWMQTVGTTIPSRRDGLKGNESIAAARSWRMSHKFSIYV